MLCEYAEKLVEHASDCAEQSAEMAPQSYVSDVAPCTQ
jgi:hypothetical protein